MCSQAKNCYISLIATCNYFDCFSDSSCKTDPLKKSNKDQMETTALWDEHMDMEYHQH